jgi:hypothetical protein
MVFIMYAIGKEEFIEIVPFLRDIRVHLQSYYPADCELRRHDWDFHEEYD